MSPHPPEPSTADCSERARSRWQGWVCMAMWYPQMGGYVGRAVVCVAPNSSPDACFEVYVWHDGEFPFSGDRGRDPVRLHHCDETQFERFATEVAAFKRASGDV